MIHFKKPAKEAINHLAQEVDKTDHLRKMMGDKVATDKTLMGAISRQRT